MTPRAYRSEALGVAFAIDERFADVGFEVDPELPTAHLIASAPREGWIAALAVVTVRAEPLPPEAAALAGHPAVHVRYRLLGGGPEDEAPVPHAGPVPASLVEHWTLLVEERRWLLAMELMVQPPERWEQGRDELELPFRSLELI